MSSVVSVFSRTNYILSLSFLSSDRTRKKYNREIPRPRGSISAAAPPLLHQIGTVSGMLAPSRRCLRELCIVSISFFYKKLRAIPFSKSFISFNFYFNLYRSSELIHFAQLSISCEEDELNMVYLLYIFATPPFSTYSPM